MDVIARSNPDTDPKDLVGNQDIGQHKTDQSVS